MGEEKTCVSCGNKFQAKRADAKYCSAKCRLKASRGIPDAKLLDYKRDEVRKEAEPYDREANLQAFRKMGLVEVEWLTTGIAEFDELTQVPRGRVTQIQGPWGVGKTTLCLNMIAGMKGLKVLYIDSEAALNPELLASLEVEAKNFSLYNESAFIEDIYDVLLNAVAKSKYDMIIFDSLAACTYRTEAAGEAADANIGQKAKIVNKLMRILPMELKRTNTALVVINQERDTIGNYGPIKYTPGGMGVPYSASLMVALKSNKADRFPSSGPPYKGQTVEATIIKSKVNQPHRKSKFKLYYGSTHDQPTQSAGQAA